jgi:hypothetical protein
LADADELLRDAQYAFQNVSHASMDSKKFASRAGSLARRIIRKYPASPEAAAARSILEGLGERLPKPTAQFQHVHSRTNEHRSHVPAGDRSAPGWLMPGWPLRLMQAIPVVMGVILLLRGFTGIAFAQPDIRYFLLIAVGGALVYLPKLSVFADLVSYAKSNTPIEIDWYAEVDHLPTLRDINELVTAFLQGNSSKRLAAIFALFFLSGFLIMFSAVLYVVGARKAFDRIEGWLLDRDDANTTAG